MNDDQVCIGVIKEINKSVYLNKHVWDCGWYWGFGYLETSDSHFHLRDMIPNISNSHEIVVTPFNELWTIQLDKRLDGWIIMELFTRAYIIKDMAELYYRGSAGIGVIEKLDMQDRERSKQLNSELEQVLNEIWKYISEQFKTSE